MAEGMREETDADGIGEQLTGRERLLRRSAAPARDLFVTSLRLVGPLPTGPAAASQVVADLEAAPERSLSDPGAPPRPGLYALYLQGRRWPVYVGKAGGRRGVQGRLTDHAETIRLHHNLDPARVRCRYVLYAKRAPLAHLEAILIRHYRPPWNALVGFGSGRSRQGLPPVGRWEERYPRRSEEATPRFGEHPAPARERRPGGTERAAEARSSYDITKSGDLRSE
jgi:hypothetical protein